MARRHHCKELHIQKNSFVVCLWVSMSFPDTLSILCSEAKESTIYKRHYRIIATLMSFIMPVTFM